ncbi:MAG: IclR family transcriptional regulator [Deltaproteobacteria bacterium]|nr:IclR family transcriptional regulator [Deltaproteobacteria bacterium]
MAGAATVDKALDVLFHLHEAGVAVGLTEIGRALDLPKSSCHRLLQSLVDREVVSRDEHGRYRPGLALLSLGIGAQRGEPVIAAARPILEEEARALGETVFLVGLRHDRLRVLDKVEGPGFLRAAPGVGDVVPAPPTAAGKLYAIFGPSMAATGEVRFCDGEAETIRRRGYALNRDAWIEGLSVLGVPVWQATGAGAKDLVAVMALAAASPRFDQLGESEVAGRLLASAARAGERLGGVRLGAGR